jgi:hypothetical protein
VRGEAEGLVSCRIRLKDITTYMATVTRYMLKTMTRRSTESETEFFCLNVPEEPPTLVQDSNNEYFERERMMVILHKN